MFVDSEQKSYCRDFSASTSHSIASSSPVPFTAEVLKICHFLSLETGVDYRQKVNNLTLMLLVPILSLLLSETWLLPYLVCSQRRVKWLDKGCEWKSFLQIPFLSSSSSNIETISFFEIPILSLSTESTT